MADDISIIVGTNVSQVGKEFDRLGLTVLAQAKRVEALEKSYSLLDKAFNKGKIDAQQYAKGIQQVDAAMEQALASSNALAGGQSKAAVAATQLANAQRMAGKDTNRFGMVSQQVGYQVGDFFVQVQSGTNALVAFGQQGTQLAGLLPGLAGAILGIGISVGTAIGAYLMRASEGATQFKETLDALGESLSDFQNQVKDAEGTVSSFAYAMAQVQSTQIEATWAALGDSTAGAFEAEFLARIGRALTLSLRGEIDTWTMAAGQLAGENFAAAFGTGATGILTQGLLDQIGEAIKDKNVEILDETIQQLSSFSGMTAQGAQFVEYLIQMRDEANGFTEVVKEAAAEILAAKENGEDLSKLNLKLGIDEARKVAELLAANMNSSLADALGIVGLARGAVLGGRGRDPRQFTNTDEFREQLNDIYTPPKERKGRGGGKSEEELLAERIAKFEKQLRLERDLVGVSESRKRVLQALGTEFVKNNQAAVANYEAQIEAITEATRLEEQRKQIMQTVESSLESGFMTMVDGTKSVKDAFKDMARQIIADLYRVLVVQRMVGSFDAASKTGTGIVGAIGKLFANANGNAFANGRVTPFANGGVVNGPTMFPMSGGQTGLMGEAGPEAIMPLKRDKNGRLGVSVDGGSGSVVVNNNINVTGGTDPAAIRMEVAKLMPQITNATKTAVIDARRRGGQMRAAFGS